MNVFLREMKAYRKSLIIWSFGILFLIASSMQKFSAMNTSDKSINEIMKSLPRSVRAIFGVGDFDLTKASGFYGVIFVYLLLMAGIHAGLIGSGIISKEERDKTTEFLFVKPRTRVNIITSKLAAALVNIIIFNIVSLILSIGIVDKYAKGEAVNGDILLLSIGLFLAQLLFMFIGACIAATSHNPKLSGSAVTGILLFMYFISVCVDLSDKLQGLKYITVFKYFDASKIMYGGGLSPLYICITVAVTIVLGFFIFRNFKDRDLGI